MSRLLIGSDNERLCCLVSLHQCGFCFFFFFLEYGRNGNIGLNQRGTKRHAH